MTALADLRAAFEADDARWRAGEPRKPHAITAYNAYVKEACRQGQRPDALDRTIEDEEERFFSKVLQGSNGHAYWSGNQKGFTKNDGTGRHPRYWLWEREHGPLPERGSVKPVCGELHCIAADHQRFVPWSESMRMYTDAQCLGALQTAALRLGHTPTAHEYRKHRMKPEARVIETRFGSWDNAVAAAVLPPARTPKNDGVFMRKWSNDDLIEALRARTAELGHAPKRLEWDSHGWSPSRNTFTRRFGGWSAALEAAGVR